MHINDQLLLACRHGNTQLVGELLGRGANVSQIFRSTTINWQRPVDLSHPMGTGNYRAVTRTKIITPLSLAIFGGYRDTVEALIEGGVNLEDEFHCPDNRFSQNNSVRDTALTLAIRVDPDNRIGILTSLLEAGANPNHTLTIDGYGNLNSSPLHVAISAEVTPNAIRHLVQFGASLKHRAKYEIDGVLGFVLILMTLGFYGMLLGFLNMAGKDEYNPIVLSYTPLEWAKHKKRHDLLDDLRDPNPIGFRENIEKFMTKNYKSLVIVAATALVLPYLLTFLLCNIGEDPRVRSANPFAFYPGIHEKNCEGFIFEFAKI